MTFFSLEIVQGATVPQSVAILPQSIPEGWDQLTSCLFRKAPITLCFCLALVRPAGEASLTDMKVGLPVPSEVHVYCEFVCCQCVCARACVRACVCVWFRGAMVAACADVRHHVPHMTITVGWSQPIQDDQVADVCQPCLRQTYQRLLASRNSQPVLWGVDHPASRPH